MGMEIGSGRGPVKQAEIQAVIIRADGTRIELGRIAYYHRNPFKRWAWEIGNFFKRRFGKGRP